MPKNKKHKQRFASKHSVESQCAGRVVKATECLGAKCVTQAQQKQIRLQQAQALRKKRQEAVLHEKRLGSAQGPPRIVGIIPANESGNTQLTSQKLQIAMNGEKCEVKDTTELPVTISSRETKQRLTLFAENNASIQDSLDVAKVSDIVVLCLDVSSAMQENLKETNKPIIYENEDDEVCTIATWFSNIGLCITDYTRELISSLNAQGCPTAIVILQGIFTYDNPRVRARVLKLHTRYFSSVLSDDIRVLAPASNEEYEAMQRTIQTIRLRTLKWREIRPYLLVEERDYHPEEQKLVVKGYLRGTNLSANNLVHLTNHGTFQIESVGCYGDPHSITHSTRMGEDLTKYHGLIEESTEETRESLAATKPSDTLDDEQNITADDLVHEQMLYEAQTKKVIVPEGVSEYQAAWYDVGGTPVLEEDNVVNFPPVYELNDVKPNPGKEVDDNVDRFASFDMMSRRTIPDVEVMKVNDVIRLEKMTETEKEDEMRLLKEQAAEEEWNPDWVDTPIQILARQRFAKYRGMKSFQTGRWDPHENLPLEYGYIFTVRNFKRVRQIAMDNAVSAPAQEGLYFTITILNISQTVVDNVGPLLILSGLLQHEQKWSVLHFQVERTSVLEDPIKSKTPMLAHIGFRKFYCSPLYSDITAGDRTKFSRYFLEGEKFKVATFFGPISYAPCPVLLFNSTSVEEQSEGTPLQLMSYGSALPPNPERLLLKRTVLTGRIAVIYRKVVVIKFMFFNEGDVKWFQPMDLYTRLGRRGRINKSVGSKGLFKAVFNDVVMQHDTVCMDLYKRVYPKWDTVPYSISEIKELAQEVNDAKKGNEYDEEEHIIQ